MPTIRNRPQEAFECLAIPVETSHRRLLKHARRVATLLHVAGQVDWRGAPRGVPEVVQFGIALSQAYDLAIPEASTEDGKGFDGKWLRNRAGLHGPGGLHRLRYDVPRYEFQRHGKCPGRGPRGGKCSSRSGARWMRVLTNPDTGEYTFGPVCPDHRADVIEADPSRPRPNTGGVLAEVFRELGFTRFYRHFAPDWQEWTPPEGHPTPVGPPKLSVILGAEEPPASEWPVLARPRKPAKPRLTLVDPS